MQRRWYTVIPCHSTRELMAGSVIATADCWEGAVERIRQMPAGTLVRVVRDGRVVAYCERDRDGVMARLFDEPLEMVE